MALTLAIHTGDARRRLNTSRHKSHPTQSLSLGSWGWTEQTATGVSKSEPLQRRLWKITSLERCAELWWLGMATLQGTESNKRRTVGKGSHQDLVYAVNENDAQALGTRK